MTHSVQNVIFPHTSLKMIFQKSSWATMGLVESLRPIGKFLYMATLDRKVEYRISDHKNQGHGSVTMLRLGNHYFYKPAIFRLYSFVTLIMKT